MISSTLSSRSLELNNSTERLEGRSPVQRVVTYKEKKSVLQLLFVDKCVSVFKGNLPKTLLNFKSK